MISITPVVTTRTPLPSQWTSATSYPCVYNYQLSIDFKLIGTYTFDLQLN